MEAVLREGTLIVCSKLKTATIGFRSASYEINKADQEAYVQQLVQATNLFYQPTRRVYFWNNRCGLNGASLH